MTSAPPQWTIGSILQWTAKYFTQHKIDTPRLDAEILLSHALSLSRVDLYMRYDQPLDRAELNGFRALIKRRAAREPVAYITGEKEFWSLGLSVTPDVLIPRPETEVLVQAALDFPGELGPDEKKVLDLGTGSGAIILALAKERPQNRYLAVDKSPGALGVAQANARRHDLLDRVSFLASDWFSALDPGACFDLIVSNPPYVSQKDLPGLEPEIRNFEPQSALDGGPDGLGPFRKILSCAREHLCPGGLVLVECGADQKTGIEEIVKLAKVWLEPEFLTDFAGLVRVVRLRLDKS